MDMLYEILCPVEWTSVDKIMLFEISAEEGLLFTHVGLNACVQLYSKMDF